jgi:GNAT superfamily N-acetyltransferase
MKMQFIIREAQKSDLETIVRFQEEMAWDTEQYKLDHDTVVKGVEAVLTNDAPGVYYLACTGNHVAGSLLITYEWSDWRNGTVIWIQSVYVEPAFRKKGVYRSLYNHLKSMVANDDSLKGIRLYVDETNKSAHEVYSRLGMNGEHYRVFEWMK